MDDVLILAIETSCDETSVAVVKNGKEILSNIISSQVSTHSKYGGVVPEIASRMHLENMNLLLAQALEEAGVTFSQLDAVGVTYGPGLIGALLVGVSAAKAVAASLNIPLIGVNHMHGHVCANLLEDEIETPFISLIVSGGHTYLLDVASATEYTLVGRTRDDACGESFDKVARSLGLGYPGGPIIDEIAVRGDPEAYNFPRVLLEKGSYDFSFSGLKTAVLNELNTRKQRGEAIIPEDVAAGFQKAVIDVLEEKTFRLMKERGRTNLAVSGGVAANGELRRTFERRAVDEGYRVFFPPKILCTDNAAMIGIAAYHQYMKKDFADLSLTVDPNLGL